jgi:Tol biopolymer transport system component
VAFVAVGPEGNWDLYVAGVEGSFSRRLTEDPFIDGSPMWSQNGRFLYNRPFREGEWQVWKMPAEGGDSHLVLRQAVVAFESEDGRFLYYVKSRAGFTGPIWRTPVDGGSEGSLVLDEAIQWSHWRLWRGNLVYLVIDAEEGPSIKMMDLRTREVTRLADLGRDGRPGLGLTVSPDGLSILYTKDESKGGDIMLVENPR